MSLNALKVASILSALNKMDRTLGPKIDQSMQHAKALPNLKLVAPSNLLRAMTELYQETLKNRETILHLVSEVETLSRSSKDAAMKGQIANIRGLYKNLDNKLVKLHDEAMKAIKTAMQRMNDPSHANTPADGPMSSGPLQSFIDTILSIITLLVIRRKELAKR